MKKTMRYLSIVILAAAGTVMAGCNRLENQDIEETPNQKENIVTLTTQVGFDTADSKALTSDGVKTFEEGDMLSLWYEKAGGGYAKVVSEPLISSDITDGGASASFTFTLADPKENGDVDFYYPASVLTEDGNLNNDALFHQDGSLSSLARDLDWAVYFSSMNGTALPHVTLGNIFTICAYTLLDPSGNNEITQDITGMTIHDGMFTYTVTRAAAEGPIYVALLPTSSATINYTATDGTKTYAKCVTGKTYEQSNLYKLGLKMNEVVGGKFSVSSTKQVYFSKGNLQATTSNLGNTWTWNFAANQWDKVGAAAANNTITSSGTVSANGTVDLFGWSTSETYLGINKTNSNNAEFEGAFVEWGAHADVTKTIGTGWRTLTGAEWNYLISTRETSSGLRFCKAKVGDVFGVILLPDDWSVDYYSLNNANETTARNFDDANINNKMTVEVWNNSLASHGAVFLPTAGQRNGGNAINAPNGQLHYWSSTTGGTDTGTSANANHLRIDGSVVYPNTGAGRCNGFSVRLVYDVR